MIPEGKIVSRVEMMFENSSTFLLGIRMQDSDLKVILTTGCRIDDSICRKDFHSYTFKSFTLSPGERLLGIKSCSVNGFAKHQGF